MKNEKNRAGGAHPAGARDSARSVVRKTAIEILLEAASSGRFVDEILSQRLGELEERDRHLLQEISYGTIRHRSTLDHLIDFHLKLPVERQRPALAWALRLGAYQLIYLGRIPPHAAVNQTLEGLKAVTGMGSRDVGFVNAILHKLAADVRRKSREGAVDDDDPTVLPIRLGYCHFNRPVLPVRRLDTIKHLGLKHSHPLWLVTRWLERYGEQETQLLCTAQNRTPSLTVRTTRLAPSREAVVEALGGEGFDAQPGALEESIVLIKSGGIEGSATRSKGWFQVQDETAIRIGAVLAPPVGARVLDLCAAPGGKATQLLERVGPEGHVVAADRSDERLTRVRENLSRLGSNFTTITVQENPDEIDLGETFSHILVDAPCSNTGVLARRPEARWRVKKQDLQALATLQSRLLEAALRHLSPGGRLLYATCSIEPEENEAIIADAFTRHPNLIERETQLFLPHRCGADGGFYSLLIKARE
jgi:16S rRNA (cytosine967-C5)-methyltransferase